MPLYFFKNERVQFFGVMLLSIFGVIICVFLILLYFKKYTEVVPSPKPKKEGSYYGYDSKGGRVITEVYQLLDIDINSFIDTNFYINNGGRITIFLEGTYYITYRAQFETKNTTGGQLATYSSRLEIDGNVVKGSESSCFIKKQPNSSISCGCGNTVIIYCKLNSVLSIKYARTKGTTSGLTKSNESSLTIRKIS